MTAALQDATGREHRAAKPELREQLPDERGFSDARFADHETHLRFAVCALIQRQHELARLLLASNEAAERQLRRSVDRSSGDDHAIASTALRLEQRAVGRREQILE